MGMFSEMEKKLAERRMRVVFDWLQNVGPGEGGREDEDDDGDEKQKEAKREEEEQHSGSVVTASFLPSPLKTGRC